MFLGRRLNVRWYQPERDNAQTQQQMINMGIDLQALGFGHMLQQQQSGATTSALLSQLTLGQQESVLEGPAISAAEELQVKDANWSAMVGMWLNDYVSVWQLNLHVFVTWYTPPYVSNLPCDLIMQVNAHGARQCHILIASYS